MKNPSFLLSKGSETKTVSLEDLGGENLTNIENYKGYKLPSDLYEHLSPDVKKAWDCGWHGYLEYFCGK